MSEQKGSEQTGSKKVSVEHIMSQYSERLGLNTDDNEESENLPENTPEANAKAQVMVDKILARAEKISLDEYTKIPTLADLRKVVESLTPESLTELDPSLDKNKKEIPRILELLRVMVNGRDHTTGLQNKFALNDSLRKTATDIITTGDETEKTEKMRRSGLIYFDVRGLKMVNDARKNHSDGDAFIARVADETKVVAEQIFAKILGPNSVSGIFRDGGDEFAIALDNSQVDLEAVVTSEMIDQIFPESITITRGDNEEETVEIEVKNIALASADLKGEKKGPFKLVEVLAKILETMMFDQKFVSESFPREVIENHLKKGRPEYTNEALADFDLPLLIAYGAQTNYGVLKETKNSYHKKPLSDEKINELGAAETLNLIMSAMRLSADQRSYDKKNTQNRVWMASKDPFQQLLIDLVSRNEITVEYAESLRKVKKVLVKVYSEKEEYREENLKLYEEAKDREQKCQETRQELAETYTKLEKSLEELAEQKRKIEEITRKIHLLTV